MTIDVKICGISDAAHAHAAAMHGATWLGFIFFPPSPRNLSLEAARKLAQQLPVGPKRVGVFVDATDDLMMGAVEALSLDAVQLHGSETPADAARIKKLLGVKVIKAIAVNAKEDIEKADPFLPYVDRILFDAKPPEGSALPGGNATSFPWQILGGTQLPYKWMLAGGLTVDNAAEAVASSGATALDVSSGVETAPGKKSSAAIQHFLRVAKAIK